MSLIPKKHNVVIERSDNAGSMMMQEPFFASGLVCCPQCGGDHVVKKGVTANEKYQRHKCRDCDMHFKTALGSNRYEIEDERSYTPRVSPDVANGVFNEIELRNAGNVLAFSCLHLPFEHPDYLAFVKKMYDHYDCKTIICLGDFVDHHGISMHEKDPDGYSAGHEAEVVIEKAAEWARVFPNMYLTMGNHDKLCYRNAYKYGTPNMFVKTLNDAYDLPDTWKWCDRVIADGVVYQHGTGRVGENAAKQWMNSNRRSTVIGHVHSNLSVMYSTSPYDRYFAMSAGCGIKCSSYAFVYNRDFSVRPVLGCCVVLDHGRQPIPIPMYL